MLHHGWHSPARDLGLQDRMGAWGNQSKLPIGTMAHFWIEIQCSVKFFQHFQIYIFGCWPIFVRLDFSLKKNHKNVYEKNISHQLSNSRILHEGWDRNIIKKQWTFYHWLWTKDDKQTNNHLVSLPLTISNSIFTLPRQTQDITVQINSYYIARHLADLPAVRQCI